MKRVLFLMAILIPLSLSAKAAQSVAIDEANPPFMYADDGKVLGIYPALIEEAFRRMGTAVTLTALPWKRALKELDAGTTGVAGIYKNSERLKKYDYSGKLFDEVIVVYVAKGKGFAPTSVKSFADKTVGVLRGWSYGDDFDAAVKAGTIKVEEAANDAQNFGELAKGRLDAVLAIRDAADIVIPSENLKDKVEPLAPPFSANPSFLAFAKTANKADLLARFDATLAAMHADGTFDKIVAAVFAAK